jgi:hypothetical protein
MVVSFAGCSQQDLTPELKIPPATRRQIIRCRAVGDASGIDPLWLAKPTHLMQQRFGSCGMLVAVGELQPFPFHLAPELARPGFARPHGVPAAFRSSIQAFSDFGRHSPIKPVGTDGSTGKNPAGECPSSLRRPPVASAIAWHLERDPEKWAPIFGKDHAQTISRSGMTTRRKVIPL